MNVIKAIQKELEWQQKYKDDINPDYKIDVELVGIDADPLSAGFHMIEKSYIVPMANDEKFIPELLEICKKEKIDILIPILSYEIPIITENRNKFEKIGVKMALSDCDVYKATENKIKTNELFDRLKIPYPEVYNDEIKFPAIIKPLKDTSGAKNVHKVETQEELDFYKKKVPDSFIQEFVEGQEYTIDGLCDLKGKMLYALPRKRLTIKFGMAVKSITEYNQELIDYTRKIVEGFGIVGAFNIQCIKNNKIWFIEVNNRFPSGGLPLVVGANLNIPVDIIRMLSGKKVPPFRDQRPWIYDKMVMIRFQDAVILKTVGNKLIKI